MQSLAHPKLRIFDETRTNLFERPDLIEGVNAFDGRGHPVDHRSLWRFDEHLRSSLFERLRAPRAVVSHARKDRTDHAFSHGLRRAFEKPINRRQVAVIGSRRDDVGEKTIPIALDDERTSPGTDEAHSCSKLHRPGRLSNMNAPQSVKALCEGGRELLGHMLRHKNAGGKMRRKRAKNLDERGRPARRCADDDE